MNSKLFFIVILAKDNIKNTSKMKNLLRTSILSAAVASLVLVSCGQDKPVTSETTEVTTTKDGNAYVLDTLNSKIEWKGYKVFKSENTSHFGTITFESGDLTVKDGKLESGKFVASMNSLTATDLKDDAEMQAKLDGHLKADDFFDVANFPTASYEITKVTENASGDYNTTLEGNMTIKGITKPVKFNANVTVNNGEVTIATEPTDVNREEYGVKFQAPAENGVVKNEITLQISIKALETK